MQAEIIAVGHELLGASRLDTNSLFLTRELAELGIRVVRKSVLPDHLEALAAAIAEALRRVPLLLCTGGLGSTEDDRTRAAAALALGVRLRRDPDQLARLRRYFELRQRPLPENVVNQADRLETAEWLPNGIGTAPGQWCPRPGGGALVLLPGPPAELQPMFTAELRPRLAALSPGLAFFTRVLSIAAMSEAEVEAIAAPIYRTCSNPETTILATADPQVELHFCASAPTPAEAQARADDLAGRIAPLLAPAVFSCEGASLAAVVGGLLLDRGESLAVAESCTAGLLGARITAVAGASAYFPGGVVCYSNQAKMDLLGVPRATLRQHGAVSAACACEMAEGARRRLGSNWALSITGIAGPGGGSEGKPVGTVFIGCAGPGQPTQAQRFQFSGSRDRIRRFSAQSALNLLRLRLLQLQ